MSLVQTIRRGPPTTHTADARGAPLAVQSMQKIILPFVSGFLAALFFHEATLALLRKPPLLIAAAVNTPEYLVS